MQKALLYVGLFIIFVLPGAAFASATITSVSLNGGSAVQVNPGDNIVASVTATLTSDTKWKGTDWGISTVGATPTCTNTKNAKDGTRNNDTGIFTEAFIAKAPSTPGLYAFNVVVDQSNTCGQLLTDVFTLPYTVRVGSNTVAPTIAAHSDISVQLVAPVSGIAVAYSAPAGTDHFGNPIAVACNPASGTVFPVGNTLVSCTGQDSWGNNATPSYFTVNVSLPPDVIPPVIASHADISVQATSSSGAVVSYSAPTAIDDRDGAVPVSCAPISGSLLAVGTTTVICSARDAAGNIAHATFSIGVYLSAPQPVIIKSQPDESYMCKPDESDGWRACYTGGSSFTIIDLGQGSGLSAGALTGVTIALDPNFASAIPSNPFNITLSCSTDATFAAGNACTDWAAGGSSIFRTANQTSDQKHWTADFSNAVAAGGGMLVFKPNEFYQLKISDVGVGWPMFGQDPASHASPQPYWIIHGVTH